MKDQESGSDVELKKERECNRTKRHTQCEEQHNEQKRLKIR